MTFKAKNLSSSQIPNLLLPIIKKKKKSNLLKFQRKGKSHQENKTKLTNATNY